MRFLLADPVALKLVKIIPQADEITVEALTVIGFALGGNAGARVSQKLALGASANTLLRRVRSAATAPSPAVRVLGVDDWAIRRRERYGTILVDLERRQAIDLLPDREGATVEIWLKENPGVAIATRDRSATLPATLR
jgi:hypothetical protein